MNTETVEKMEAPQFPEEEQKKAKKKNRKGRGAITFAVVIFIISAIFVLLTEFNASYVNISADFSSSLSGENPDGTPLKISEVLCDDVIARTVEKLDGAIDEDTLKKHLSISQYTSSADLAKVKNNIVEGNTEYTSVPVLYRVTYATVSEEIKREGIGASIGAFFEQFALPEKNDILDALAESYCEYYEEIHVQSGEVLTVDWAKTDSLDYYNRASSISGEAGKIIRFVQKEFNDNIAYVSDDKGIGYGELLSDINRIVNVDLENYKSFVVENGLTSDKATLLRQLRYSESKNHDTYLRETKRYEIIRGAIDFYDADVTRVVFIPALDNDQHFYMNRTKVGMDYLVELADNAKLGADEAKHNEVFYGELIAQFANAPDAEKNVYKTADAMYADIKAKIDAVSTEALEVLSEHAKTEDVVRVEAGDAYSGISVAGMAKRGAKTFVILAAALFLAVSFAGCFKGKKTSKK